MVNHDRKAKRVPELVPNHQMQVVPSSSQREPNVYKLEHKHSGRDREFSAAPKYTASQEARMSGSGSRGKHAAPPTSAYRETDVPYLKPLPKPPRNSSCHRSKHKRRHALPHHLQKHHSDESLASYAAVRWSDGQARAHSSADEISSLNHSPSVSSSDESFSKTTDASPSPSPPIVHDTKRWLFTSGVNPCSSPEISPHHSCERARSSSNNSTSPYKSHQDATANRHREKTTGGHHNRTNSSHKKEKITQETLMALAMAEGNTTSESTNCLSAMDSYQGDSCTSFEYKKHSKRRRPKHSISNLDKNNRIAKYLGHEKWKAAAKDRTQMLTAKKDSSSQTDLKLPHCVTSLLKENVTDIEKKIYEIFEEQELLQNMSDSDLMKKSYSNDSLSRDMDVKAEKGDNMKRDPYELDESYMDSCSPFLAG